MRFVIPVLLLLAAFVATAEEAVVGLPLNGEEAVAFLRTAEVVGEPETFDDKAITAPVRVTLTDGERTLRAIFKDESTYYPEFKFGDGTRVERVTDTYKHELAAYELDVLLGLGIVPPCVERELLRRTGSLCMWVEEAMDEAKRRERRIKPPDLRQWYDQMHRVQLFQHLVNDLDRANIRNIVSDPEFKIYKVDSSMSFYPDRTLRDEDLPTRFSRQFLEALESLDQAVMDEQLQPWTRKSERKALWARRQRLLDLAAKQVEARGESEVLY